MACHSNHFETLFSFEILVEYIRIDNEKIWTCSDELALGVRLLDFPTLLIYQRRQDSLQHLDDCEKNNTPSTASCDGFKYQFNKGKSCLFKINLNSLHTHLSNTPLYAMVLDVKEELPKLIGTSLISLSKIITNIKCDVEDHGVSNPSSQGESRLVDIFNLMGEKIGLISLRYKLVSLGASLLPHIPENKVFKVGHDYGVERTKPTNQLHVIRGAEHKNVNERQGFDENILDIVSATTQTEHDDTKRHALQVDYHNDQDVNISAFCPPHLFYCSSVENKSPSEIGTLDLLKLNLHSPIVDDLCSGNETPDSEIETPGPPIEQKENTKLQTASLKEETQSAAANVFGEALRQLPLLNALLVELSQLTGQTEQQQPLSIHPHLAWIYRPVTDTLVGQANSPPSNQTTSKNKPQKLPSLILKDAHTSKKRSTPHDRVLPKERGKSSEMERACPDDKVPRQPTRKKLAYGTTKTFRLRMKQVTPGVAKRCECHIKPTVTHTNITRENASHYHGVPKGTNPIEAISSIAEDSALKETSNGHANKPVSILEKETTPQSRQGEDIDIILKKESSHLMGNTLLTQIPSVGASDASHATDSDHKSEWNHSETESDSESRGESRVSLGSRRYNSPKPACSPSSSCMSSREYIDDFTSVDPSDGYSPAPLDLHSSNPFSSPEPVLVKSRSYPVSSDLSNSESTSEKRQKRRVLPMPIKAHSSPERSLRSTQMIHPHNQPSTPYISSESEDVKMDPLLSVPSGQEISEHLPAPDPTRSLLLKSLRLSRSQLTYSTEDGVGKTTLVQKACETMRSSGVTVEGFYTEEVREGGRRVGFDVVTMSGERGHLSRVRDSTSTFHRRQEYTVGQYVVDLPSFENLALPLFRNIMSAGEGGSRVFVIDEIGKMELFSQSFIRAVRETLDSSACCILGTIPIPKGKPMALVEEVRGREDVKVFTVSKENRNSLLQNIVSSLQECLKGTT